MPVATSMGSANAVWMADFAVSAARASTFACVRAQITSAARASAPLFRALHAGVLPWRWLLTLALYDLLFGLITFAVFDFLLED